MARIRIPKRAGAFNVSLSVAKTYLVSNDKSGGNRINIPCKSKELAEALCEKLNRLDPHREHEIWV
jgi:hypothetical protein